MEQHHSHRLLGHFFQVKRSVSASLAGGDVFMTSEGMAEMWMDPRGMESAIYRGYDPTLHRRRPIIRGDEPTVTVMNADSVTHLYPSTVCIVDAKKFVSTIHRTAHTLHSQYFLACGSRPSRLEDVVEVLTCNQCPLKELFIILAYHVSFALVVV